MSNTFPPQNKSPSTSKQITDDTTAVISPLIKCNQSQAFYKNKASKGAEACMLLKVWLHAGYLTFTLAKECSRSVVSSKRIMYTKSL